MNSRFTLIVTILAVLVLAAACQPPAPPCECAEPAPVAPCPEATPTPEATPESSPEPTPDPELVEAQRKALEDAKSKLYKKNEEADSKGWDRYTARKNAALLQLSKEDSWGCLQYLLAEETSDYPKQSEVRKTYSAVESFTQKRQQYYKEYADQKKVNDETYRNELKALEQ